jgi:23S rRNA G2445 N2-methylase RlmL
MRGRVSAMLGCMNTSSFSRRNLIVVTTAKGMVPLLTGELEGLGLRVEGATATGVSVMGDIEDALRMNLYLRTAHRVLWKVGDGVAHHPDQLHKRLMDLAWEDWIPVPGYVSVTASGQSAAGDDPRFVALKTKDAIMDRIKGASGHRPDAGPQRDRTVVHMHWEGTHFTVYLDSSGESLSQRGYRLQPGKAPMRETLAAACLLGAGWNPATPLVNPMCGSGTIAIEAALLASRTAPGLLRENFGFMHIKDWPREAWASMCGAARRERIIRPPVIRIIAGDRDAAAVDAARANARRAGVDTWIHFSVCDFRETRLPPPPGLLVFNPEYGERMGESAELAEHYRAIGDFMKLQAQGYTGAIFTGNADMIKPVGLKPRARLQLFNGPIEGRLLVYDLYAGTKRDRRLKAGT